MLMLGVREMDRSLAFYRDVARDLRVQFCIGRSSRFWTAEASRWCSSLEPTQPPRAEAAGPRSSFRSRTSTRRTARCCERGVAFRIAPRVVTGDRLAADFRDPDGHVLSIFGPRKG